MPIRIKIPAWTGVERIQRQIAAQSHTSREIIFIDRAIQNYSQLADDLLAEQDRAKQFQVVPLDGDRDGVTQIDEVLSANPRLSFEAIHIVAHGIEGGIRLGNVWLTGANLDVYARRLSSLRSANPVRGDLLLYGCDLAAGEKGRKFVQDLSALTGRNVGASADETGSEALGGNWNLEYSAGIIDSDRVLLTGRRAHWAGLLAPQGVTISGLSPSPLGNEIRVNTTTAGEQWNYYWSTRAIAVASDGSFIKVWIDTAGADGSLYGIFGQRYNGAGSPVGGEFLVNMTTSGKQDNASIAMRGDGGFMVVWDGPCGSGQSNICGQRYLADGTPQGSEFQINTTSNGAQRYPEMGFAANNTFIVAWVSNQGGGGAKTVFQRFDADANKVGGEVLLSSSNSNDQILDSLSLKSDGSFIIAWTEAADVYCRLYNADMTPANTEFRMNQYTTGTQQYSIVRLDAQGNFVVVWESMDQDGSGNGIYARRFSSNGTPLGNEFGITSYTTGNQFEPQVAMDAAGNFVVHGPTTARVMAARSRSGCGGSIRAAIRSARRCGSIRQPAGTKRIL